MTTNKLRSVEGKILIVSGAASGIGRAIATAFAEDGARIAVADINLDGARSVASELRGFGATAQAWALDVSNPLAALLPMLLWSLGESTLL